MRRVAAGVAIGISLVAGCGSGSTPARRAREVAPPPVALVGDAGVDRAPEEPGLDPPPLVHHPALGARHEGPPDGVITELAVTREVDAALTVDEHGGVRLWPTLDGTREPVTVALPRPVETLVARRGTGFVVALRDEVGGLVIAQLDPDGRVLARATIAPDPAVTGLAQLDAGILAWRVDHTIVMYGPDGQMLSRLAAEPGERIETVAATRAGAVVIVSETSPSGGTTPRARTIVVTGHHLGWGEWRLPGPDLTGVLAVSRDGKYLARLGPGEKGVMNSSASIVELATGKEIVTNMVEQGDEIAFSDDTHVAIARPGALTWMTPDGALAMVKTHPQLGRVPFGHSAFAAGNGRVVLAVEEQLVIAGGVQDVHYLGYGLPLTRLAVADTRGGMVLGGSALEGMQVVHMDCDFRVTKALTFASEPSSVFAMAPLGGDDWLFETVAMAGRKLSIEVVDEATGTVARTPLDVKSRMTMSSEPTTGLVGLSDEEPAILQHDAATHNVMIAAKLPRPASGSSLHVVPVAPGLAGGTRLVKVLVTTDAISIEWLADEARRATTRIAGIRGSFATVDRAGHVYVWEEPDRKQVSVFADGKRITQLPETMQAVVKPDPQGTRVVIRTRTGVALYSLDGTLRWELPMPALWETVWLDDATLALVTPGGIARVDAATGAVTTTRCGWEFSYSATPLPLAGRGDSLCDRGP